jgi:hypothetical protein
MNQTKANLHQLKKVLGTSWRGIVPKQPTTPFRFTLLTDFRRVGGLSGTPDSATREGLLSTQSGHRAVANAMNYN